MRGNALTFTRAFVAAETRASNPLPGNGLFRLSDVMSHYLIYTTTYHRLTRSRVEAGSNTFTVALGVVGGDEMGSLEFETVK
jgi:hypothetical protein